jgi:nitrate reductase NapE component
VHRLLRIKPMKDFIHMSKNEWIAFLLLTFWTTFAPLVCFCKSFGIFFQILLQIVKGIGL